MAAKKNSSTRRTWLTVAGVVVLPLLLVATMVATVWGADQRNDQVKAAIVNLDEPVTLDDGQYVPLGRQLAGKLSGLTNVPGLGEDATNYDWQVTNAEEAAEGLRTGRYAAVVTIPENFSEAATSTADADKAEQALVDIEISPRASSVDPSLARTVVQAAIDTLNTELTETFLDNIFVGFSTMGEQFKTISDASEQLADGTHELANGIDELDDGVSELADGTEQLDSGGAELSDGVKQYVGGVTSLADGLKQLDQQVSQMPGQVKQLADGADQTADGADELAKGAKQLSGGASDLADGIDQTGAGAKQFADQLGTAASGAKQLGEAATGANAAAQGLAMGLQGYSSALQGALEVVSCPDDYESGSPECDAYVRGKTEGLQFALQALEPLDLDTTLTGLAQATGGLDQGINGDEGLANGLDQAADGAKQLSDGI
ncbi:MAG TPA: YhgE/Pip family protein, partial [Candidatus Avipropionibacterium avicola]|nr:YhgE/Pip family protein [Candidatus Avipropionibacterium avicola]